MNINDVVIDHNLYSGQDRLKVMFEKQDELRQAYEIPILELDLPKDQKIAKTFAWCIVEEAAETLDVVMTTNHQSHIGDEISDTIAFYLELLIISGLSRRDLDWNEWEGTLDIQKIPEVFTEFVTSLAMAINTLKSREWRKTNLKTDVKTYHERLTRTFPKLKEFVARLGLSSEQLFDYYLRKHSV